MILPYITEWFQCWGTSFFSFLILDSDGQFTHRAEIQPKHYKMYRRRGVRENLWRVQCPYTAQMWNEWISIIWNRSAPKRPVYHGERWTAKTSFPRNTRNGSYTRETLASKHCGITWCSKINYYMGFSETTSESFPWVIFISLRNMYKDLWNNPFSLITLISFI